MRYRTARFAVSGLLVLVLLGCSNHIARRQAYLDANPDLPDSAKVNIMAGKIWLGMSRKQLIASIGEPKHVEKLLTSAFGIYGDTVPTSPPPRGLDWSMERGLEPRSFALRDSLVLLELLMYEQPYAIVEVECQNGWVTKIRETPRLHLYYPIYRFEPPPMPPRKQ